MRSYCAIEALIRRYEGTVAPEARERCRGGAGFCRSRLVYYELIACRLSGGVESSKNVL